MKLVLLRHEQRDLCDPLFFSPLTHEGIFHSQSSSFIEKLHALNIDIIYSSPFERCIQTIGPYCLQYKKYLNIEYSLYEFLNDKKFLQEPVYNVSHIKDCYEKIINCDYKSLLDTKDFTFSETDIVVKNESINELYTRVSAFLKELIEDNKEQTILLVTHEGVIHQIENYLNNSGLKSGTYECINMGEIREYCITST